MWPQVIAIRIPKVKILRVGCHHVCVYKINVLGVRQNWTSEGEQFFQAQKLKYKRLKLVGKQGQLLQVHAQEDSHASIYYSTHSPNYGKYWYRSLVKVIIHTCMCLLGLINRQIHTHRMITNTQADKYWTAVISLNVCTELMIRILHIEASLQSMLLQLYCFKRTCNKPRTIEPYNNIVPCIILNQSSLEPIPCVCLASAAV